MMSKLFVLFSILCSFCIVGQVPETYGHFYTFEELVNASPDTVFAIDLSKQKLSEIPEELYKFKSVKALNLGKNKFESLPLKLAELKKLEYLDISKNSFYVFPNVVTHLTNLKILDANRNYFDQLPNTFGALTQLETLLLWDTPVFNFPASFFELKSLKWLDVTGVRYGPAFQEKLIKQLPNTKIDFDAPCNCME